MRARPTLLCLLLIEALSGPLGGCFIRSSRCWDGFEPRGAACVLACTENHDCPADMYCVVGATAGGYCAPTCDSGGRCDAVCMQSMLLPSETRDTDGDGTADLLDDDDDGDGRTDAQECYDETWQLPANSSFEEPDFATTSSVHFVASGTVPAWATVDPRAGMEIWDTEHNGVPSWHGGQHVELNVNSQTTIYRDIDTIPGMVLEWALYHRGRAGADTLELWVGAPEATESQGQMTSEAQWTRHSGFYLVPVGQVSTRFEYRAVDPRGSHGNLLDLATVDLACPIDTDGDGCPDALDPD